MRRAYVSRAAFYIRSVSTRESELDETERTLPGMAGEISPFLSHCVTTVATEKSVQSWHRRVGFCHYLISLFARASTSGGIVRPICFAVLRLITSSNFVGCSTGRSAGLAALLDDFVHVVGGAGLSVWSAP